MFLVGTYFLFSAFCKLTLEHTIFSNPEVLVASRLVDHLIGIAASSRKEAEEAGYLMCGRGANVYVVALSASISRRTCRVL